MRSRHSSPRAPQASCRAMGQVAGEAAALASKKGCSPLELPLDESKKALRTVVEDALRKAGKL